MKNIYLYIDGDNQSSKLASDLISKVTNLFSEPILISSYIFCNHSGILENWNIELSEVCQNTTPVIVPFIKNAADVSLIMFIGCNIKEHNKNNDTVIIVSRDQILIDFANLLSEQEICDIYLAFDKNITVNQLFKNLKIITLVKNGKNKTSNQIDNVINSVYKECLEKNNNKCTKAFFCDRLNQLGFKKCERKQILKHQLIYEYIENGINYIKLKSEI